MKDKIQLIESRKIRSVWDEKSEKWWFSVIDIVAVLTDQPDYQKVRNYWKWLKNRLKEEGSELVSNTNQLKLTAADGKKYLTGSERVSTTNQLKILAPPSGDKCAKCKKFGKTIGIGVKG
jgi:hypothetical protein